MLPTSASRHYRALQRLQVVTLSSLRRAWRRMDPTGNWPQQYQQDVGPKMLALTVAAQVAATREADSYVADVLNELDFGPPTEPGVVRPTSLAGWAGDGRPVRTLLAGSVVKAGRALNAQRRYDAFERVRAGLPATPELDPAQALRDAEAWIDMVAQTLIADATRAAESVALSARPWVEGYVRMLNPPSCSRCAILAGRFYLWNAGFERHPRCDCIHIPASEANHDDLRVNPDRYFRSLSRDEQDRIFTNAGAEAIRDGADIGQVVNARRGMRTAAQNQRGWIPKGRLVRDGQGVFRTTEGTTRRALASRARTGRNATTRLMPESIYEVARDRDDAIRLLRVNGYIL